MVTNRSCILLRMYIFSWKYSNDTLKTGPFINVQEFIDPTGVNESFSILSHQYFVFGLLFIWYLGYKKKLVKCKSHSCTKGSV